MTSCTASCLVATCWGRAQSSYEATSEHLTHLVSSRNQWNKQTSKKCDTKEQRWVATGLCRLSNVLHVSHVSRLLTTVSSYTLQRFPLVSHFGNFQSSSGTQAWCFRTIGSSNLRNELNIFPPGRTFFQSQSQCFFFLIFVYVVLRANAEPEMCSALETFLTV